MSAVCWTPFGELFSCSDDSTICRWSTDGACLGTVCRVEDSAITDIHWFPSVGNQVSDQFAISCTDGAWQAATDEPMFLRVSAHTGGVCALPLRLVPMCLPSVFAQAPFAFTPRRGVRRSGWRRRVSPPSFP